MSANNSNKRRTYLLPLSPFMNESRAKRRKLSIKPVSHDHFWEAVDEINANGDTRNNEWNIVINAETKQLFSLFPDKNHNNNNNNSVDIKSLKQQIITLKQERVELLAETTELKLDKDQLIDMNMQQRKELRQIPELKSVIRLYENKLCGLMQENTSTMKKLHEKKRKLNVVCNQKIELKKENIMLMETVKSLQSMLLGFDDVNDRMQNISNRIIKMEDDTEKLQDKLKEYEFNEKHMQKLERHINESTALCNKCQVESYATQNTI